MKTNSSRTLISALCLTAVAGFIYAGAMVGYDSISTPTAATHTQLTPSADGSVGNGDGQRGTTPISIVTTGSGGIQVGVGERPPARDTTATGGIQVGSGDTPPARDISLTDGGIQVGSGDRPKP